MLKSEAIKDAYYKARLTEAQILAEINEDKAKDILKQMLYNCLISSYRKTD